MGTVRAAIVLALVVSLAAVPGTALGRHAGHGGSANTMSLRAAARVCADYTPKAEARLHRIERRALGGAHAAEHARHGRGAGAKHAPRAASSVTASSRR